ncbi:DUF4386 family protein [Nonomuraea basaltis]|uniref:DUF4386 family protein n=1 Tax=Nonomuraea basaltis TaxID=2495887 RepID=UPI00110C4E01|nr:DUF4386 family protein [Nonomuraea basaltis]TMR88956.1 DUF4386 family protein [Nonomuraea basaltis]
MFPNPKISGWFGVLAGVGLLVEGMLWTVSGWNAGTFADPTAALRFLAESGTILRWAVLSGFLNLVFFVVLIAGLAGRLRTATPTLATATLWFGMIGITAHVLVPMGHWYGVPAFLQAAARDQESAESAWTAFMIVGQQAAGGAGSLFMGLSMLCAGWAIAARRAMPVLLGWLGLIAGVATLLTLFAPDTPLSGVAGAAFMPSLLLAIVFRIWAGLALTRSPQHGDAVSPYLSTAAQ